MHAPESNLVRLELHDMVAVVLPLEVLRGAELAERALGIDQAVRDLRASANDPRCDHILCLPIDLSDRLHLAEVPGDAAQLLVHVEEGKPWCL
jgi:hypothetical protein